MVVSGVRMKERGRFLAAEGFNVQLKKKVRRIIEEHSERQGRSTSRSKVGPSGSSGAGRINKSRELSNYTIVASSRGEHARNRVGDQGRSGFSSFSVCETNSARNLQVGKIITAGTNCNGNYINRRRSSSRVSENQGIDSFLSRNTKLPSVSEASRKQRRVGVRVNVLQAKEAGKFHWGTDPVEEKDGFVVGQQRRFQSKLPSSLIPHGNGREPELPGRVFSERKTAQIYRENGIATSLPDSYRTDLRRSPSTTLPNSWKKPARVGVKKSVSFSSDTSFQEKKSLFCSKTYVHEAKVYHKGVLQDRASQSLEGLRDPLATSPSPTTTTTTTTVMSPGGSLALVRAAREGSNTTLRQIMARAKNPQGTRDVNINGTDASGRTAISYMAGNGAFTMLEAALNFPEVDVNLPDNEGNTPLHFAAQAGQLECVGVLLQRGSGIEVDARNTLGFTPLMKAALQGRTKCAKILLFAGANPTLRDYGRGLRAEQWARFCGRYVCAEVIERFARHRLLERTTSCRWGSEPELAARVLQGKVTPMPTNVPPQSSGLRSKIRRVFRTSSGPDNRSFSLVSQLTSAALCASSPALPRSGDVPPVVKSLIRPLSVPQLRITLVAASDVTQSGTGYRSTGDKFQTNFTEKIVSEKIESNSVTKPPRSKKKNK